MSISMYGLLVIVAIALLSLRRVGSLDNASLYLDTAATTQLRGLAIVFVILSHLILLDFITMPPAFTYAGAWGVAIFLLLSGFGLTRSYLNGGVCDHFFAKRFKRVLLPYIAVTFIWLIIDMIALERIYSWQTVLLALVGMDFSRSIDPTMWYITFIILWYLLFYLAFKLPVWDILKIVLLFGVGYVFRYHATIELTKNIAWQWSLHAYLFPLGTAIGFLYTKGAKLKIDQAIVLIGIGTIGLLCLWVFSVNVAWSSVGLNNYMRANMMFAFGVMALAALMRYAGLYSKLFAFLGLISYEVYLVEWAVLVKYRLFTMLDNKSLTLALSLFLIILGSLALRQSIRFAIDFCNGNRKTTSSCSQLREYYAQAVKSARKLAAIHGKDTALIRESNE